MPDRKQQTREMLAKHHRDGGRMAQMMKESFESRFDELFWNSWQRWIEPVYSDTPVVLDLGSGPGLLVRALAKRYPGMRAIGVEVAPYMLAAIDELPAGCEIIEEDLHDPHLPLADASVDAAMASIMLHEMEQPLRALQEMHRVIRPGGRFYVTDWVRAPLEVYLRQHSDEATVFGADVTTAELEDFFVHFGEHNRFSREDLIYLLNHAGFAVIHSEIAKEGRFARIVAERR